LVDTENIEKLVVLTGAVVLSVKTLSFQRKMLKNMYLEGRIVLGEIFL
jgi:hypothetical protein